MAKIYYDKDANLNALKNKTIAIIGYGIQGRGQALCLRDSGLNVIVSQRKGGPNYKQAIKDGFKPVDAETAAVLARLRVPIRGWNVFDAPVRSVYEASYAAFVGEQGELLDLPWLARVGTGLEFQTGGLARYAPPRVRVMLRYVFGEDVGALGVGAGIAF